MSEKKLTLRLALLAAIAGSYNGVPANSAQGNLVNAAPSSASIPRLRVRAGLSIATDETTRQDKNSTPQAAARPGKVQSNKYAATDIRDARAITDFTNIIQTPLSCAMLQNGVFGRPATLPPAL